MNTNHWTSIASALLLSVALLSPAQADTLPDFSQNGIKKFLTPDRTSTSPELSGSAAGPAPLSEKSIERRIVIFDKGTAPSDRRKILEDAGATVTTDLWLINGAAIITSAKSIKAIEMDLLSNPHVTRIDTDFVRNWIKNTFTPLTPRTLKNNKEEQKIPWGIARVNAPKAWPTTRGEGIKVAVIDTGIDFEHPDLKVLGGYNSTDPAISYKDDHGHGTHVAGTIAALNNRKGVVGIAPAADLYGVKVLDAEGSGTLETVIGGIQWAVENKMDIANMSLGADTGAEAFEEAINAASDAGLIIIAAAGNNSGPVGYPAAYKNTIAISASTKEDRMASFSSRGPEVDFIAPGAGIESTYKDGEYKSLDGTSMACPHVTGLAVLAMSANKHIRGTYRVRRELRYAATRIPDLGRHRQGRGMIDAAKLVAPDLARHGDRAAQ